MERRILYLLGLGLQIPEIARWLRRSVGTIQHYRGHLRGTFRAANDVQLLRAGIRAKVIPADILTRTR